MLSLDNSKHVLGGDRSQRFDYSTIKNSVIGVVMLSLTTITPVGADEKVPECLPQTSPGVSKEVLSYLQENKVENITPEGLVVANMFQKAFGEWIYPEGMSKEKIRIIPIFFSHEKLQALGKSVVFDERMTEERIRSTRYIDSEILFEFTGEETLETPTDKLETIGYFLAGEIDIFKEIGKEAIIEMSISQIDDMRFMLSYQEYSIIGFLGIENVTKFGSKKTHLLKFFHPNTLKFIGGKPLKEKDIKWIAAMGNMDDETRKVFHEGSGYYREISMAGHKDSFNETMQFPNISTIGISIDKLKSMTPEEIIIARKEHERRKQQGIKR